MFSFGFSGASANCSSTTSPTEKCAPMLFQKAIENGDIKTISSLTTSESIVNSILPNGEKPLNFAIRKKQLEVVNHFLLNEKISLDHKDDQGLTAIDHSVLSGDQDILAAILQHKIGANLHDVQNEINLNKDIQLKSVYFENEIIKWKNPNVTLMSKFHRAAFEGKIEDLKELVSSRENLDKIGLLGITPLQCAILGNNKEAVVFLLNAGARADILSTTRESAMHFAALINNLEILNLLKCKDLDLNQKNNTGFTPLHFAVTQEQLSSAHFLIKHGADPLLESHNKLTALKIVTALTCNRGALRDPLKIDPLQALMFAGIVSSWCAYYFSGNNAYILSTAGAILKDYIPFMLLVKNVSNSKAKIGAMVCEIFLSSVPGINYAYSALKTMNVAKYAFKGLGQCWRNAGLEGYRPLRNGVINSVNLFQSVKVLNQLINPIVSSIIMAPGILQRMNNFIPICTNTGAAYQECFSTFFNLENSRASTGVQWEHSMDGMEERLKMFTPMCSQEINNSEQCTNLFWSLEADKYTSNIQWQNNFSENFFGRSARHKKFNTECLQMKRPQAMCDNLFNIFDQKRYQFGIKWEKNIEKMFNRWEVFSPICESVGETATHCDIRFFSSYEIKRYFEDVKWEKIALNKMKQRWEVFSLSCRNEFSVQENVQENTCGDLFFELEKEFLKGKNWEKVSLVGLKDSHKRWELFKPECESIDGSETCPSKFIEFEVDRILNLLKMDEPVAINTSFEGMTTRNTMLRSETSLHWNSGESKELFWTLEKERAQNRVKWEDHVPGVKKRSDNFFLTCNENIKDLQFKNPNACSELFKGLESERFSKGAHWEENWQQHSTEINSRWQEFNAKCTPLDPQIITCENVFWQHLEPSLYSFNGRYEDKIADLKEIWKSGSKFCKDSKRECENRIWNAFINSISKNLSNNADKGSCAILDPKEFEGLKNFIDVILHPKLDPTCKKHAEVILELGEGWDKPACKKSLQAKRVQYHPDKFKNEHSGDLSMKIEAAGKTLCPTR